MNDSTYLQNQNDTVNVEINKLLEMFDRVGSTQKEDLVLKKLNKNHARLIQLEANLLSKDTLYTSECAEVFSAINTNITELAALQIKEGRNQKFLARNALDTVQLFSKIEIYFLIFLGLLLQIIILYKPKNG